MKMLKFFFQNIYFNFFPKGTKRTKGLKGLKNIRTTYEKPVKSNGYFIKSWAFRPLGLPQILGPGTDIRRKI